MLWFWQRRKLGNQEAPKALVVMPWKCTELGNAFGSSRVLEELRLPIYKEVFKRMLSYYEIGGQAESPSGAPTKMNAAQLASAAHRRKP